ncbi:hypothetical protein KFE98_16420 [bacterium SCSIO 12741]|nr:hypothetical protein KFE98_16420 [bacterium SCSIO 12741]
MKQILSYLSVFLLMASIISCSESEKVEYEDKILTPEKHLAGTWNFDTLTSDSAFCLQGISMEFDQIQLRTDSTFQIKSDTLTLVGKYELGETELHFYDVTANGRPETDEFLPIHEISKDKLIFQFELEVCKIYLKFKRS